MNEAFFKQHYNDLLKQRKQLVLAVIACVGLLFALAVANLYQIYTTRVVIVPPQIERAFYVTGSKLSEAGLEQHGAYFAHLLLDVGPETINNQHKLLLQNVHPSIQEKLKEELIKIATTLKKLGVSSRFNIKTIKADVKKQQVIVKGKLCFYQGPAEGNSEERAFLIQFNNQYGKPFIAKLNEVKNEK